jgi:hypothetical protein
LRALRLVAVVVRGDGGLAVGRRDDDALEIAIGSATTVRQIRTQLRTMIERHL